MAKEKESKKKNVDYSLQKILDVEIQKEMKKAYVDYAMSVIVGRALPDVRDGFKPVHRRIIYTMFEAGLTPDKPHKKCATTVGDVLGKYHPHGDAAVYDALARMAQDFSLRYPMVDGHGNFGSVDGDPPAAYRYTEARMAKMALEMVRDIDKNTIDMGRNYDDTRNEPTVLPSRVPNLLLNGSSGIAVGMATNIPPHNLNEVSDAIKALIDDPEITIDELIDYVQGPDFPTAGIIMGRSGIRAAYHTGHGRIILRARCEIEEHNNRQRIVVTELPYQVNKAKLIERIADLVKEKRLDGISDIRDESDANIRLIIEIKRDANATIVLNNLYHLTQMQDTFSCNMLALVNNEPKVLNLKEILVHYVNFQKEVIVRRTRYDLDKAEAEAHILQGLIIALDNLDEVIQIIRTSYNNAKERLIERFGFSERQAQAILDMRLARLQGLEREKIEARLSELEKLIDYYHRVLNSEQMVNDILKEEISEIQRKFGDERRTHIEEVVDEIDIEDLIEEEDNVFTITNRGYIKRQPTGVYKSQHRGGRGIMGMHIKEQKPEESEEQDFAKHLFIASTHAYILFFTNKGRMFKIKGYQIPESGRQAMGTFLTNLIPIDRENGEVVCAVMPVRHFEENQFILMITQKGIVKKTPLMEYATNRKGGLLAISIDEDDALIQAIITGGEHDVVLGTHNGMAIRFKEQDIRVTGRVTRGVKGIELRQSDYVVGAAVVLPETELLVVTERGYGKKTEFEEYKVQKRGGMGLRTYKINEKTGKVVAMLAADETDDLMIITSTGVIIRISMEEIRSLGRSTSGVRLMKMEKEAVSVIAVTAVKKEEEIIDEAEANPSVTEKAAEEATENQES